MIARRFGHFGLQQLHVCTQVTKATVAETSYNQLSLIDPAIYVLIEINLLTNEHFTLTTNLCAETLTTLVTSHVTRSTICGVLLLLLMEIPGT